MKTSAILALAAANAVQMVAGHATVFNILVNDVDQGLGNSASGYIRSPPNNNPITDVTSKDMTCNVNGGTAAAKTIEVAGGDKITFEWHHNNNEASDDIIADSHKGPVLTYIAPADSNGEGDVWLKLAEEGYADGKWAVDNLIANRGKHSVTLPDLAAGEYLLRPEIIALHEGNRQGGAQFYMECVQIKVTSSGSASLPAGVAIPGAYTATDAGVLFDIYNSFTSYPVPGPKVWDGASGSGSGSGSTPASSKAAGATPAPSSAAAPAATSAAAPVSSAAAAVSSVAAVATSAPAAPPKPTTLATVVKPASTSCTSAKAAATGNASGSVQAYGQCGGQGFTGSTACANGWVCKQWNPYYSQCVSA